MAQIMTFLPGTMCDQRLWGPVWQRLIPRFSCDYVPTETEQTREGMLGLIHSVASVRKPIDLVAFSMGGYLALRAMVEGRVAPDAAVLVAPMLGLRSPVGAPIGGLYAAGEVTGLYHGKYTGATSVLRGLVFGRIAGRHAVERCVARRSATSLPDKE